MTLPIPAELAARITAARAVLGDFWRPYGDFFSNNGQEPDWQLWALRLASVLGSVLDGQAPPPAEPALVLTASWPAVLGQALADAVEYRTPGADCAGCDASAAGLCADHAEDLGKTDAYLQLARTLGIEVDR